MARARVVPPLLVPCGRSRLALVLLAPLLRHPGHLLARDLVFVPHQPLTDAAIGLGGVAPRSVPLDAVVAVMTSARGRWRGRTLSSSSSRSLIAGWGTLRLTDGLGTTARLAASGFAVWNPFVVERMSPGSVGTRARRTPSCRGC